MTRRVTPSRVYTRLSTERNLMTDMETLSILILAWLRWKEVSTLTTSSIEFVRPFPLPLLSLGAVEAEVDDVAPGSLGIMAAITAEAVGAGTAPERISETEAVVKIHVQGDPSRW